MSILKNSDVDIEIRCFVGCRDLYRRYIVSLAFAQSLEVSKYT